jgi:triacylglycerol lipase
MELSPIQSIEVADGTYALRDDTNMLRPAALAPTVRESFNIEGGTRLTGLTGLGAGISQLSGFGYVAWGTGSRQGECIIAVRGTHPTSAFDWLTNARMGGIVGPRGYVVHNSDGVTQGADRRTASGAPG